MACLNVSRSASPPFPHHHQPGGNHTAAGHGLGDLNVSLKYNFLREREIRARPALAIAFNLELPTGDKDRQLGSGLADFYINGILQKSLT